MDRGGDGAVTSPLAPTVSAPQIGGTCRLAGCQFQLNVGTMPRVELCEVALKAIPRVDCLQ